MNVKNNFWHILSTHLIYFTISILGLICFVVPGLIYVARNFLALPLSVISNDPSKDPFKTSKEISNPYFGQFLILNILYSALPMISVVLLNNLGLNLYSWGDSLSSFFITFFSLWKMILDVSLVRLLNPSVEDMPSKSSKNPLVFIILLGFSSLASMFFLAIGIMVLIGSNPNLANKAFSSFSKNKIVLSESVEIERPLDWAILPNKVANEAIFFKLSQSTVYKQLELKMFPLESESEFKDNEIESIAIWAYEKFDKKHKKYSRNLHNVLETRLDERTWYTATWKASSFEDKLVFTRYNDYLIAFKYIAKSSFDQEKKLHELNFDYSKIILSLKINNEQFCPYAANEIPDSKEKYLEYVWKNCERGLQIRK